MSLQSSTQSPPAVSSRRVTIGLVLADVGVLFPQAWTRFEAGLHALADPIRSTRGSGGDVWRSRVVFSTTLPVSGRDFRVLEEQVLPRSSGHRCIETEFDRGVGQGGF